MVVNFGALLGAEVEAHRISGGTRRLSYEPQDERHLAGVDHAIGIIVATKAELEGKGISFYSEVNVVEEGVLAGWRWVYFEDPDGYPLELVQVTYYNADERRAGIEAYLDATRSFEANT